MSFFEGVIAAFMQIIAAVAQILQVLIALSAVVVITALFYGAIIIVAQNISDRRK